MIEVIINYYFYYFCNVMTKIEIIIRDFSKKCGTEFDETKEAGLIIHKHISGEKLTAEDKIKLKQQIGDVLKGVGIGIPIILIPGASILIPIIIKLAKRYNIELLPSSFNKKD